MQLLKRKENGRTFPSVFSDFFNTDAFFSPRWFEKEFEQTLPAVNIKENGKQFNIEVAAPGFNKNDFKINVEVDVLTISAEKKEEKSEEDESYARKEYSYTSFSRSFTLPENSNSDKIDATYENGILKLMLPKREEKNVVSKREVKIS